MNEETAKNIFVSGVGMSKGMKTQKGVKRSLWILSATITLFLLLSVVTHGRFLSRECLRKIANPTPNGRTCDYQHVWFG